ncbi:hypothetical protein GCM10010196_08950 [Agromyces mediolanus]|uniref:Uncharacterized protein n=1 Tax=Agromyces mediolanus TaxID=41986 RepID=A0A918F849_AGRME|nr:hypothetical protein GCM10010196_08950 [Agromyces mediolanus]
MGEQRLGVLGVEAAGIGAEDAVQRVVGAVPVLAVGVLAVRGRMRRGVGQCVDVHELGREGVQQERLESAGVVGRDRRRRGLAERAGHGAERGIRAVPAIGDPLDQLALLLGEVAAQDDGAAHAQLREPREALAEQRLDRLGGVAHERPRVARVLAADRVVGGGKHDAAVLLGRSQADAVGGERVEADRQVRAVELERAERQVRDGGVRQARLDLLGAQPLDRG